MSTWTRINPNDRDTWPRPGNLVLVANDYGAAFNLRGRGMAVILPGLGDVCDD